MGIMIPLNFTEPSASGEQRDLRNNQLFCVPRSSSLQKTTLPHAPREDTEARLFTLDETKFSFLIYTWLTELFVPTGGQTGENAG